MPNRLWSLVGRIIVLGIGSGFGSLALAGSIVYQFRFSSSYGPAVFSYSSDGPTAPGTGLSSVVQTSLPLIFPLVAERDSSGNWSFAETLSPSDTLTFLAQTGLGLPDSPGFYPGLPALITQSGFMGNQMTGTVDVLIQSSPAPSTGSGGIVNAAGFTAGAPVAPGSLVAVFGSFQLIGSAAAQSTPLPDSLLGLSLQSGAGTAAPLLYVSPGQVNLQLPWELSGTSETTLAAALFGQPGAPQPLRVAPFAPGIFTANAQGAAQGAILDSSYRLVDPSNPATPGTTIVLIYCTGLGAVTAPPPTGTPAPMNALIDTTTKPVVTIGGAEADVLFSGLAPGSVGLYQVNARVPAGLGAGNAVPVVLSIGGATSNTVTIAVQ